MSIQDRLKSQRYRVSMNIKHICTQAGDKQLVLLQNGQYGELPVRQIEFHREGQFNESPWTRWYDLSNKQDAEDLQQLRDLIEKNPNLKDDIDFRIRIVGEFDNPNEPWPGYDDQDSEQVTTYYNVMPANSRPTLESMVAYELGREVTNESKVIAIEALELAKSTNEKRAAKVGVDL